MADLLLRYLHLHQYFSHHFTHTHTHTLLTNVQGLKGQFVPWGKHIPRYKGHTYFVATGVQECKICQRLITASLEFGRNYPDLCGGEQPEYMPMCLSQMKVLQACPEFINNWCYQDFGGSQVLKSPCPDLMICHYCLGVNPLHCIEDTNDARESFMPVHRKRGWETGA